MKRIYSVSNSIPSMTESLNHLFLALVLLFTFSANSALAADADEFDAAQIYQNTCFACHGTGAAHAPEVGDVIEWEIRLEKGLETLVQNTVNGLNGIMPAKGLCVDCTEDQLKDVVEYMLENSQ